MRCTSLITNRTERRSEERGAALVEAAIIFFPLCLILFGIIEFGFVFKDSLTLSSATRAGARTASSEPQAKSQLVDTLDAVGRADAAITPRPGDLLWIFQADANGNAPSSCTASSVCTQFQGTGSGWGPTPTAGNGWWTDPTYENACVGIAQSVGVLIKFNHTSLTGFFPPLHLTEKTVMRLEPLNDNCGS